MKQDVHNMAKVLVDLIADKQGWDDRHVWKIEMNKFQDTQNTGVLVEESIL